MHDDEVPVSLAMAGALICAQFPRYRDLPVKPLAVGTDHAIFRVGSKIAARFPRRREQAETCRIRLEAEARSLAELAACCPVPCPEPLGLGRPGHGYPMFWSLQTFLPGEIATPAGLARSDAFADDIARLIASLRRADTKARHFDGRGRGGSLTDHDAWIATCLENSRGLLDVARLSALWARLRLLPPGGPDAMSHRDLIPANLLVKDGRLAGVLDGGAFGPADPALDLVACWHLFDTSRRARVRQSLGSDEVEWQRGAAWAFAQAIGLVWYYEQSNPDMAALGRSTLARLLDDG
ncbi:aminoglycoside phosphotransferase family protein [Martelella soudanensis]|uniref:aminoglycoside phosphotransferase family protein n=1 Tax=unclassified Martelella TaxID=2629616 RepID=UPI0015E010E9|nr:MULTISPECIES: aminoglycoside phosphotransferase family protein [unclassified Martelella]